MKRPPRRFPWWRYAGIGLAICGTMLVLKFGLGWPLLLTLPLGGGALVVLLVMLVIHRLADNRPAAGGH